MDLGARLDEPRRLERLVLNLCAAIWDLLDVGDGRWMMSTGLTRFLTRLRGFGRVLECHSAGLSPPSCDIG